MSNLGVSLLVLVALTLVNAFFSASEIAILSVRKTRLRELGEAGEGAALVALQLREDPERFLATVQIGITVVGATAGAFGGLVLDEPFAAFLRAHGVSAVAAERVAFALVVSLVSVLSVVIGELVPKSLALRSAETVALLVSRPLYLLSRLAGPLVWALTKLSNLVLRPFRDQTNFTEARLTVEELHLLVGEAAAAGTVDKETGEIATRAIELGNLRAYSVMVPRREVVWLAADASREHVERTLRDTPHARYPITGPDHEVQGYVLAREIYAQLLEGKLDLAVLVRDCPTFSSETSAVAILRTLQGARTEIGLIVDEGGFPVGLVSIETLAEELFGEIVAEHEKHSTSIMPTPAAPSVDAPPKRSFLVRGETPLHEVNRELDLDLPIDANASTLGGLVLAICGRFPERGHSLTLPGGVAAQVVETSPRRVLLVRLEVDAR